ncbi:cytochrome P450 [Streptomyces sp. NPDC000410]|uniref:cytochrome P450 family protein n=1 Tax=Streptomyces sp. NPDC000410 TaxID=3154254 RepID=UPI00332FB8B7
MPLDDVTDLSADDPALRRDPYPRYARLRATAPLVPAVVRGLPGWLATGHDTVQRLLADQRLSMDRSKAAPHLRELAPWVFATSVSGLSRNMLLSDAPDHTRLRRPVSRAFTPRRVEELRPWTEDVCRGLIDRFRHRGQAELVEEFAVELPLQVISELLGVPEKSRHDFRTWSVTAASEPDDPREALAAYREISAFLSGLITSKRKALALGNGGTDLLSAVIAAQNGTDALDDDELRSMAFLLLLAGHETTANVIGNSVLALLRHPDRLAELRDDPSATAAAVEELLRYDSVVAVANVRFATEEIRMGDAVVAPGDAVLIGTAATGRDPAVFDDPDTLDFHRPSTRQHLGFGHGIHYCLGAPLARMELSVALPALLRACDNLTLAVPEEQLVWRRSPNVRGVKQLPVTFTPGGEQARGAA